MAISHELNSEITAALLAAKERSPRELEDLKNTLLIVHSTLQELTDRVPGPPSVSGNKKDNRQKQNGLLRE